MKKPIRLFLIAIFTWTFCGSAGVLNAQDVREFTNSEGTKISGTITAATEKDVTLKLADGRDVTGGITFFSKDDQEYIAKWRKLHPQEFTYDFNVDVSRERTRRDKTTERQQIITYEDWLFKVKVENRSKTGIDGVDLRDLELHYNIMITAESRAQDARSQHRSMVPKGAGLIQAGKVSIDKIGYLRSTELKTDTVPVNASELAPGYYYPNGAKDNKKDNLKGIWVKIVRDGKVLFEKTIGSKDVNSGKWVDPSGSKRNQ